MRRGYRAAATRTPRPRPGPRPLGRVSAVAPDVRVAVLDHPLVEDRLRHLRDEATSTPVFRQVTEQLARIVAYEALRDAPTRDVLVDTPVAKGVPGREIDETHVVVPILRAGLGMLQAVLDAVPRSRVCLVGIRRDEATLEPRLYHDGLPERLDDAHALVCDPMLATGGSASLVTELLLARGARRVTVLCLVACVSGVERVCAVNPAVDVVAAGIDERLNEVGYIVPGLGDAGDRLFGAP